MVDGVEVSVTTSKIISEDEKKDEEMRFLRQVGHWEGGKGGFPICELIQLKSSLLSWSHLGRGRRDSAQDAARL